MLAGPGGSLVDAFASLERAPRVEQVLRHTTRDLLRGRVSLAPDEGEGYWEFTRIGSDIFVVVANFAYKDPRVEFVPGDGLVQFNFKISGDLAIEVSRSEPLRWRPSLLIWSQPKGLDISEWTAPRSREQFIIVTMRPEFLAKTFPPSRSDVAEPLKALAFSSEKLNYWQYPLSAQAFEVASRLINTPHDGPLGLVYTEALALELLCNAIATAFSRRTARTEEYSDRELSCLHAARDILMRQFAPGPQIGELARSVGMSKSTLTKGFKAVFGETIFDFSLRFRMRHALTLMRDRGWSVEQTAYAIGYAHPTSFTTAFRRHFGTRPIDLRKAKVR